MHNLEGEVQIHNLHSLTVLIRPVGNALFDTDTSEQPLPYAPTSTMSYTSSTTTM